MCDLKTTRYYAFEVNIDSGNAKKIFQLPDLPNLTGVNSIPVVIDAIEFFSNTATPNSPITGSTVLPDADLKKSFLTIYQGDLQVLYNIPCAELVNVSNLAAATFGAGALRMRQLKNLINVSWTKCFISYAGATPPTGPVVYSIGVHYHIMTRREQMELQAENN